MQYQKAQTRAFRSSRMRNLHKFTIVVAMWPGVLYTLTHALTLLSARPDTRTELVLGSCSALMSALSTGLAAESSAVRRDTLVVSCHCGYTASVYRLYGTGIVPDWCASRATARASRVRIGTYRM